MNVSSDCNSNYTLDHTRMTVYIKSSILVVILIFNVVGNTLMIIQVGRSQRKWNACCQLVRILGVIGVTNSLINIATYLLVTIAEGWILGDVLCQLHGVTHTLILHCWVWILTMASFERFLKLLIPSEHVSFFSEMNLRILTSGTIVLLLILFLGPVYGWGEYSHYRGKLDVLLMIHHNMSSSAGQNSQVAIYYYEFIVGNEEIPHAQDAFSNFSSYLQLTHSTSMRKPLRSMEGLIIPLRVDSIANAECLWRDFFTGQLSRDISTIFLQDHILQQLQLPASNISVDIKHSDYATYRDVYLTYQNAATCSLDYSDVNPNVYSFMGLSMVFNLLMPFILMTYFYTRLFHGGTQKLCSYTIDGNTHEDVLWAKVFAYAGYLSMACHVPWVIVNIASGQGVYVSETLHFSSYIILYSSTTLVFLFYFLSCKSREGEYSERAPLCCAGSKSHHQGSLVNEIHKRLVTRLSSWTMSSNFQSSSPNSHNNSNDSVCETVL